MDVQRLHSRLHTYIRPSTQTNRQTDRRVDLRLADEGSSVGGLVDDGLLLDLPDRLVELLDLRGDAAHLYMQRSVGGCSVYVQ